MTFPLKFASALVLLAFPMVEIALLIKAGAAFGFWPVLLTVLATAVAGAGIVRAHGLAVFSRLARSIDEGDSGFTAIADTLLAVSGGLLLICPGLIGDVIGFLLCLPVVRRALIRSGLPRALADVPHWQHREPQNWPGRGGSRSNEAGPVIEGEYQRVEENERAKPQRSPQRLGN